ncbi:MAG: BLUF domain-containing protein [Hyphomicrobium sp.]
MALIRLVYGSRPFGFDDLALQGILGAAQRNNERDKITGALICREDLYIQFLEGERSHVETTYDRIRKDDRHTDVNLILYENADTRLFPSWFMRHDPAKSWMWSPEEVSNGVIEKVKSPEILSIFTRLVNEKPGPHSGCPVSRKV